MAPQSILIVKLSSMGDVIHTLPAARYLREAFPQARLGWAVEESHADVLRGQTWLDEVIVWRRATLRSYWDFLTRLRRTRWDLAIDFQGIFRSAALVMRWSGARRRVGFSPSKELAHWFYNAPLPRAAKDCHAVEWYLRLAQAATRLAASDPTRASGGRKPPDNAASPHAPNIDHPTSHIEHRAEDRTPPPRFTLYPSADDRAAVDAWLAAQRFDPAHERLVVFCPDARRPANLWPEARWAELAGQLAGMPGVRIALAGGPASRDRCDRIARAAACHLMRADGQFPLLASSVLFGRAACVVTGDTGPMHLAVAAGAKVVALLGPTNPGWTGPYAADAIVLTRRLPCSPCKTAGRCPIGYDPPRCMAEITVAETATAVARQLAPAPRAAA
jgi:ADP-heptose:LPS heptosyltransferase